MKSTVLSSMIGLSATLFLMGCASSDYEDSDYAYTETEVTETSQTPEITEASGAEPAAAGDEWVIPLHEEQMNVGKRSVDSEVTLRKVVTSEIVSQPVELRKETLIIERSGAPAESASTQTGGLFQEDAFTIQLKEEQPVVEKTTVQTGQITARKSAVVDTQEIQGEVRREDVKVDRSGDTANVTYEGQQMEENAGAEGDHQSEEPKDY